MVGAKLKHGHGTVDGLERGGTGGVEVSHAGQLALRVASDASAEAAELVRSAVPDVPETFVAADGKPSAETRTWTVGTQIALGDVEGELADTQFILIDKEHLDAYSQLFRTPHEDR